MMSDFEIRNVENNTLTLMYGGREVAGLYKGFWITITRDDCDYDEEGVAHNSKLEACVVELFPSAPSTHRIFYPENLSPYSLTFADVAAWIDSERICN